VVQVPPKAVERMNERLAAFGERWSAIAGPGVCHLSELSDTAAGQRYGSLRNAPYCEPLPPAELDVKPADAKQGDAKQDDAKHVARGGGGGGGGGGDGSGGGGGGGAGGGAGEVRKCRTRMTSRCRYMQHFNRTAVLLGEKLYGTRR
jgi:uncharacterized membrane protein YgcG